MFGEKDIKALFLDHLLKNGRINFSSLIVSEMNLAGKIRRVDLSIIQEKELIAIEIKSEKDSLARLNGQLEEYRKYFDRVIVVVAPKFVETTIRMSGKEIEVWEASSDHVKVARRGKLIKDIKKPSYLDLMTRREVSFIARKIGIKSDTLGMHDLKQEVTAKLHRISKAEVKDILIEGLTKRFSLTSQRFLITACSIGSVDSETVSLLSPYHRTQPKDIFAPY
ncbi:protein cII [Ectopseudomonas oleovorans]|nr:protein cII [Pseudomonas oleovorans]